MSSPDPIHVFLETRDRVAPREPWDATACVLSTVDARGRPSSRFVLVKEVDAEGFFFYTNYESNKARHLDHVPFASLCFHWASEMVQFRIEGAVVRASAARSDAYFASRPRVSQLGAIASAQSRPLDSRETMIARVHGSSAPTTARRPRPDNWGGFCVVPDRIEHWIAGEYRLHDRRLYTRDADGWSRTRLWP